MFKNIPDYAALPPAGLDPVISLREETNQPPASGNIESLSTTANLPQSQNRTVQQQLQQAIEEQTEDLRDSVFSNQIDLVKVQLMTFAGNINSSLDNKPTVLQLAVQHSDADIIEALLQHHQRINFCKRNNNGNTELIEAILCSRPDIAELLVEAARQRQPGLLNMSNAFGWTPMMIAADLGEHDIIRMLIAAGANANLHNPHDQTALHIAVERWATPAIEQGDGYSTDMAQLAVMRLVRDYPEGKFKFNYQKTTVQERLVEEDKYAKQTLHSEASKIAVRTIMQLCIEKRISQQADPVEFIRKLNAGMAHKRGKYPMLRSNFRDMAAFRAFLDEALDPSTRNGHVHLLSIIWCLPLFLEFSPLDDEEHAEVCAVYSHIMGPTKKYNEDDDLPHAAVSNAFGNSETEYDAAFADDMFAPFHRSYTHVSLIEPTKSRIVQNFLHKNKPEVWGLSGMANLTMSLLDCLDITPRDEALGMPFCEALASFIVGSSMHSYSEVYKVFNLHLKLIAARDLRDKWIAEQ